MPRRKRMRRISQLPYHKGFRAVMEQKSVNRALAPIDLHVEEFEALKLMDYELLNQADAARYMDISRPTFTRIYESARRKMAQALVEGRSLNISGGNYEMDQVWHKCMDCSAQFSDSKDVVCPFCGSTHTEIINK
ncbi:MAG: DUF134 domain-containing protein [Bacteroidota bacterium]|nr:DUF134 domain-containing protein [Bacteroidota bacterium]